MKTNEILNTSEYSEYYNTCEYTLSLEDFLFIQGAKFNPIKAFVISDFFQGNVELFNVDDEDETDSTCRIDYTMLKVYKDGTAYLQMYEKHSEELYEVEVDEEYIKENIKDIVLENPLEVIQIILAKDISDSKKIKEIKNIIQNN